MADTVIAPDLRELYDSAEGWPLSKRVRELIERCSKAEADCRNGEQAFISMRNRCASLESENVALRAEVAKLEAPVSQAEVEEFFHKDEWGVPCVYKNAFDLVIAARGREGE